MDIATGLASFTDSLHSPAVKAVQDGNSSPWKTMEIPIGHVNPQPVATGAIPTYILTIISQTGDVSQVKAFDN